VNIGKEKFGLCNGKGKLSLSSVFVSANEVLFALFNPFEFLI
jgi:hypothetical protein